MTLIAWTPEPEPFGNATGLDHVALDVIRVIAVRLGATVLVGELPDDIAEEQKGKTQGEPREPFAKFTISWDGGLSLYGISQDGRSTTNGYRSHTWLDRIGPETLVFDLRPMEWEQAKSYAIRGPMTDPSIPDGMVSKMTIPSFMAEVADDYMRSVGSSLAETGTPVE